MNRFILIAVLAFVMVTPGGAQTAVPADSSRVTVVVYSSKAVASEVNRSRQSDDDIVPLAGATVAFRNIGDRVSNDSGYVIGVIVPAGRSDFVVTAPGHRRYRCRVELDKGKDHSVRVDLLSEKQAQSWGYFGCKKVY